ncbi:DinB family protein, partial [Pedobacter sp.]|jgi:hypothetical protein|uniref:DinB family protein n=1 Tax=Pedobacter sp. TaxID=1411316 RepID=UPI002C21DDF6
MTKQELIAKFRENHLELVDYIAALAAGQFSYSRNGKWTPGQQLNHVYLCLKPIAQALASKDFILQKFGKIDRPSLGYDDVIENYKTALANGGKAPERFVPEKFDPDHKVELSAQLIALLQTIEQLLNHYTDDELDHLVLPHPLLGNLTIREMLCLMTYHATHHLRQTEMNLKG